MASNSLSRVLNRSTKMEDSSAFVEPDEYVDSFATFHFNNENNKDTDVFKELVETDTDYILEKREESFSGRKGFVYEHFEKERKFLGTITDVDFDLRLFSSNIVSSDDSIIREVKFSMDDIPKEEIQYIEIGRRIVYIYGKQYRNGTAINESKVYFRKDSNWTEREIIRKKKKAEDLYNILNKCNKEEND